LKFADRFPRSIAADAIDRAMIIACTSQTELDLSNQRVAVRGTALVTWLIVRIVSVTVRIIAVRIVAVVWIGIVKERGAKIAKEEEPLIEIAVLEPISAKATTKTTAAKSSAAKAAAAKCTAKTSAVKATAKAATKAAAEAATAEPAVTAAATTTARHGV
jgi:hypothetical protein